MESSKGCYSVYSRVIEYGGNSSTENGYHMFGLCKRIGKNCLRN